MTPPTPEQIRERLANRFDDCCQRFVPGLQSQNELDTDACDTCGFYRRDHWTIALLSLLDQRDAEIAQLKADRDGAYQGWLPTSANLNALPGPVRAYIYQLETNVDPAGDQQAKILALDRGEHLAAALVEAEASLLRMTEERTAFRDEADALRRNYLRETKELARAGDQGGSLPRPSHRGARAAASTTGRDANGS